ncbi:hypothetical protein Dimus_024065 [Dionaea muscipula]
MNPAPPPPLHHASPPPPPPPSPPQPPPALFHHSDRVEITIFVDHLPESMGRRELLSTFSTFGSVTCVYPTEVQQIGVQVRFREILHVKRATFRKEVAGRRSRHVVLPPFSRRMRRNAGDRSVLSYKAVLQGARRESPRRTEHSRRLPRLPSPDLVSFRVDRLMRRGVNKKCSGSNTRVQPSSLMFDLGVELQLVKIERGRCLFLFDNEDGSAELVIVPRREGGGRLAGHHEECAGSRWCFWASGSGLPMVTRRSHGSSMDTSQSSSDEVACDDDILISSLIIDGAGHKGVLRVLSPWGELARW